MRVSRVITIFSLCLLALIISPLVGHTQNERILQATADSTVIETRDTTPAGEIKVKKKVYSPKAAAIRSALLPGLGQIYNRKYWKLPIVYGALGTSGGIFAYNMTWYRRTRFAYNALFAKDSSKFPQVHSKLQRFIANNDQATLSYLRTEYRRDIDYSALFFIILWGLNVVDATVDAHLKSFDVSPDLSFRLKPGYSDLAGTNGISFVLQIGKQPRPLLTSRF